MRRKIIAGNWKMHTDRVASAELAEAVVHGVGELNPPSTVEVVLCPPFVFLPIVADVIGGTPLKLGAQDVHFDADGAYTGEVSVAMLRSVGCTHVIVGHSERRLMFAESDDLVSRKANAAVSGGLIPIVCVGETIAEREAGTTFDVVSGQIRAAFDGIFEFDIRSCVIAYEPVWAIGTGNTATPAEAQEVHRHIREILGTLYTAEAAGDVPILYGGSMNQNNAEAIFAEPDIDGGLIGGASLQDTSFLAIVRAAF